MKIKKIAFLKITLILTSFFIFWLIIYIPSQSLFFSLNKKTPSEKNFPSEKFIVIKVFDGDTIKIKTNDGSEIVRLIGVNSPETDNPYRKEECFGIEASQFTKEYLINREVKLETDASQANRDQYDRLLRYIFLLDGTNFNQLLISQGYAREYTFKGVAYKYQSQFITAEKSARDQGLGLWSSCQAN